MIPKCMSWLDAYDDLIGDIEDKVDNLRPQSTPQVFSSFEVYTSLVTYPKEVDEIIGFPMEVEPLDHIKLEDLGLNTCSHGLFLSSWEIPRILKKRKKFFFTDPGDGVRINPDGVARLYLIRRSLEVLRKCH
ncbi:hypothetical protein Tco_1448757 [Tanacetum coccineum]